MARQIKKQKSDLKQSELGLVQLCTALYIRVSTEKQATQGNSLEDQRAKLLAYCKVMGWAVREDQIYEDAGISGKSAENRPALQAMLQAAKAGQIQRIVVTKFDRLARNVKDLMVIMDTLNKIGCALVLLDINVDTSTSTGKLIAGIMGQFAEWERNLIAERVMSGKRHQAGQGEYNGSPCPLGYTYENNQFTINANASTIRTIFHLFLSNQSIRAIAQAMNDAQIPTALGGQWHVSTVRKILGNGAYAGLTQWDGVEIAKEIYPPIISLATYEQAHQRLQVLRPGKQTEGVIQRRLQNNQAMPLGD